MDDDQVEIITANGRYHISEADLESYRVADVDEDDSEVEGFALKPTNPLSWNVQPGGYLSLKLGTTPIVRTNSYVMFSGETMEGAPF